jgi:hypothetical protein
VAIIGISGCRNSREEEAQKELEQVHDSICDALLHHIKAVESDPSGVLKMWKDDVVFLEILPRYFEKAKFYEEKSGRYDDWTASLAEEISRSKLRLAALYARTEELTETMVGLQLSNNVSAAKVAEVQRQRAWADYRSEQRVVAARFREIVTSEKQALHQPNK